MKSVDDQMCQLPVLWMTLCFHAGGECTSEEMIMHSDKLTLVICHAEDIGKTGNTIPLYYIHVCHSHNGWINLTEY